MKQQRHDVALVVVHGIGEQRSRETLFAWAEPICAELDSHCRERWETGISVDEVADDQPGGRIVVSAPNGTGQATRILLTEARWADAFLAPGKAEVTGWILTFAPRATWLGRDAAVGDN